MGERGFDRLGKRKVWEEEIKVWHRVEESENRTKSVAERI